MKQFGQWALTILFVILVVEIIIISPKETGPGSGPSEKPAFEISDGDQVEQKVTGFHLTELRNEVKDWELWSDVATGYKEKGVWTLDSVKAVFFAEKGGHFTVTGEKGRVNVETKDMDVEGKVVTRSSNGYIFRTEKLTYEWAHRRLSGPMKAQMLGPVEEDGGRLNLHGDSMEADLSSSLVSLIGNVGGEKTFKGAKRLVISAKQADFSGRSRYAKFKGNVIMDMNTMRITGPVAKFIYDSERDLVKSVAIKGGVRVSDIDKWATAKEVDVFFEKDKYVLNGNPRVVQNNDELVGERIVLLNGGKVVQVKRARAKVEKDHLEKVN